MRETSVAIERALHSIALRDGVDYSVGSWCWIDDDRVAWTASLTIDGRLKYECAVAELRSGKVRSLAAVGGTRGPVIAGGHVVAGGGANGATPKAWDLKTYKLAGSFSGHKSMLGDLAPFQGGARLVTGGGKNSTPFDDTVRVWDASTFAELAKWKVGAPVRAVACSSTTIYVLTWRYGVGDTVRAFSADGAERFSRSNEDEDYSGDRLGVSPDERVLAETGSGGLVLYDADTGAPRARNDVPNVYGHPAFTPDSRLVLAWAQRGGAEGTLVCDASTAAPLAFLKGLTCARLSPDGALLGGFFHDGPRVARFALFDAASLLP